MQPSAPPQQWASEHLPPSSGSPPATKDTSHLLAHHNCCKIQPLDGSLQWTEDGAETETIDQYAFTVKIHFEHVTSDHMWSHRDSPLTPKSDQFIFVPSYTLAGNLLKFAEVVHIRSCVHKLSTVCAWIHWQPQNRMPPAITCWRRQNEHNITHVIMNSSIAYISGSC